jgi:uncharacterized damage-inducible protein DinB
MAQYASWMNDKLLELCMTLPDEVRKRDQGAFFRSIHGTLDHILAVDTMLLSHFEKGTPTFLPKGILEDDFGALSRRRRALDADILLWSAAVSSEWLAEPSIFVHHGDGLPRSVTRGFWVIQMFNHQTHHRGQITTLVTQLGYDIGSTDLHMSVPPQDG